MHDSVDKSADERITARLHDLVDELGLSYDEVASRAHDHGWENCSAKKVNQIVNGQRSIRSQGELVALAHALRTTKHDLETGVGHPGEPVMLRGATATACAEARPGTPGWPAL